MFTLNKIKALSNFMLLLAAFIWGTAFAAQILGMEHIGPFTFASFRYFVGTLTLVPVILFSGGGEKIFTRDTLKYGVVCGLVLFAGTSLQQVGLQYTQAGKAGFITTLYVVCVPIFGLFLGKSVRRVEWLAVALSVTGLYLLSVKEGFSIERGDTFVIVGALFWSAHIMCCDSFTKTLDPLKLSCIQFFTSFVLSTVVMFLFEEPSLTSVRSSWLPIAYVGVLSTGVAFTLQMVGQKHSEPVTASLILSTESIFAALGGYFVLHEVLTTKELFGCVLMFAAVIIAQLPMRRNGK